MLKNGISCGVSATYPHINFSVNLSRVVKVILVLRLRKRHQGANSNRRHEALVNFGRRRFLFARRIRLIVLPIRARIPRISCKNNPIFDFVRNLELVQ